MANDGWYIITGASGAIGQAIAQTLARQGRRVLMACRDLEKSEPIRSRIAAATGNPDVRLLRLDLGDLRSVLEFARQLRDGGESIAALVNNAGVMNRDFRQTADGLEQTVGVNYVGAYALTRLLLPLMAPDGRIVNLLSCTYRLGRADENLLQPDPKCYGRFRAYAGSKLALLLFTLSMARKVRNTDITVTAADPGIVDTGMIRMGRWFDPLADRLFRPLIKSPAQGARTAVALAVGELPGPVAAIYWAGMKARRVPLRVTNHPYKKTLWKETKKLLAEHGIDLDDWNSRTPGPAQPETAPRPAVPSGGNAPGPESGEIYLDPLQSET